MIRGRTKAVGYVERIRNTLQKSAAGTRNRAGRADLGWLFRLADGGEAKYLLKHEPVAQPPHPKAQTAVRTGRAVLVVVLLALLAALAARAFTPSRPDPAAPNRALTQPLRDDYEYTIFLKRGAWAATGARPYIDVFSEYPPLATWCMGLPFGLIAAREHGISGDGAAALAEIQAAGPLAPVSLAYGDLFALWMALTWGVTAWVVIDLLKRLGHSPWRAVILLGPTALYCALQRFDPLPALATTVAVDAFVASRPLVGFLGIAVGILLKIYPVVLLFLAIGYVVRRHGWRMAALGVAVVGLVCGGCELVVFIHGWRAGPWAATWRPTRFLGRDLGDSSFDSGLAAVAVPFAYQGERDTNPGSLAERLFRAWFTVDYATLLVGVKAFRFLQFLPAVGALALGCARPSPRAFVAASAALVTGFVLFHNIYSPQFHLWIAPLAIAAGAGAPGLAACVFVAILDVATYIQFPILAPMAAFDPVLRRNVYPAGFSTAVDVRIIFTILLMTVLIILAIRRTDDGRATAAGRA
jgi:hypothetical protein